MKASAAISLLHLFGAVYSNTLPQRDSEPLPDLVESDLTDTAYVPSNDVVGDDRELSLQACPVSYPWLCAGRCCRYSTCCSRECCAPDAQFCLNGLCYKWA
jgi:hypothetical protein